MRNTGNVTCGNVTQRHVIFSRFKSFLIFRGAYLLDSLVKKRLAKDNFQLETILFPVHRILLRSYNKKKRVQKNRFQNLLFARVNIGNLTLNFCLFKLLNANLGNVSESQTGSARFHFTPVSAVGKLTYEFNDAQVWTLFPVFVFFEDVDSFRTVAGLVFENHLYYRMQNRTRDFPSTCRK